MNQPCKEPKQHGEQASEGGFFRRAFWNLYAIIYDRIPAHFRPYSLQLQRVFDLVSSRHDPEHTDLLDAGCGTGNYMLRFARAGYSVTGMDNSPGMLRRAAKKLDALPETEEEASSDSPSLYRASLEQKLPFDDGSFDCIVNINALYMLDNPDDALEEFYRVLRPGGTLVISHPRRIPSMKEILADHARSFGFLSVVRPIAAFALIALFNWFIFRFSK